MTEWHTTTSKPQLDGKPLLEPANPFIWLRDRDLSPTPFSGPRIEMHSGDVFPGEVIGFRSSDSSGYPVIADRLLVRPTCELRPQAATNTSPHIEIFTRFVRRIIWEGSGRGVLQPNTAFLRDGRRITFRAARFSDRSVGLRTAEGARAIAFSDLAELHLPTVNTWDAHLDEIAYLTPQGASRLLQIETTDGMRATTSLAYFQAYRRGAPVEHDKWVHGIQPAWSRQTLWAPSERIWMRRSFAPHEVPLSRLSPHVVHSRSSLNGSSHPWRNNRNRDDGVLRSGGHEHGWGIGCHAFYASQYPLHALVRSFRTDVGIDGVSGQGGCVRARIGRGPAYVAEEAFRGQLGSVLGDSGILVGAQRAPHRFEVALNAAQANEVLSLELDPVNKGFPAGSDPLDIRDAADWLEPFFRLDAATTRLELLQRAMRFTPAWDSWTVSTEPPVLTSDSAPDHAWRVYWDASEQSPGRYARGLVAKQRSFRVSRMIRRRANQRHWVALTVFRPLNEGEEPRLEVRLDGIPVGSQIIPLREGARQDFQPLVFALPPSDEAGNALVEVIQDPVAKETAVVWAGAAILDHPPNLFPVTEESGAPPKRETNVSALADDDAFFGQSSYRLQSGARYRIDFSNEITISDSVRSDALRFLQATYRKKEAGRFALTLHHANEAEKPATYHFGPNPAATEKAVVAQAGPLPDVWIIARRDVFAEFGAMQVQGITLEVLDGGDLLLDHLYFGQHLIALDRLNEQKRPATDHAARWKAFQEGDPLSHIRLATVHLQWPDQSQSGAVLVSADGRILAPANPAARFAGQLVQVTLSDGRQAKAKVLGVQRACGVALLKTEEAGPWPFVAVANQAAYENRELLVRAAVVAPKEFAFESRSLVFQSERRLWTRHAKSEPALPAMHLKPTLLFDLNAAWVGFDLPADSPTTAQAIRCRDLAPHMEKLLKGESVGQWSVARHPLLGAELRLGEGGMEVIRVAPDSLAAKTGLQAKDLVVKLAEQNVLSTSDLTDAVAERAPGDRVALRVLRGDAYQELALTLP